MYICNQQLWQVMKFLYIKFIGPYLAFTATAVSLFDCKLKTTIKAKTGNINIDPSEEKDDNIKISMLSCHMNHTQRP